MSLCENIHMAQDTALYTNKKNVKMKRGYVFVFGEISCYIITGRKTIRIARAKICLLPACRGHLRLILLSFYSK